MTNRCPQLRGGRAKTQFHAQRTHRCSHRGVVAVEALICLIPILVTFLGVAQLTVLHTAQLVVRHAATRAARAAVVVLDDHPRHYGGAPRGDLVSGKKDERHPLLDLVSRGFSPPADVLGSNASDSKADNDRGARWQAIESAAHAPLAVLAPPAHQIFDPGSTLADEIEGAPLVRLLHGMTVYGPAATAVTLRSEPEDQKGTPGPILHSAMPHEKVTVRVAFLVPCRVPLVSRLLCDEGRDLLTSKLAPTGDEGRRLQRELEHVGSPALNAALLGSRLRFRLITAEATLPNQGADYHQEDS